MTRPQGARMPAEWEPHSATWLAWPHNAETWPDCLARAEEEFEALVRAVADFEPVELLVPDESTRDRIGARLALPSDRLTIHVVATDDAWLRDTGPTFALARRELVAFDWIFNAWGGKYAPWDRDAAVARQVAERAGARRIASSLTLEGGALEVDGEGTLLTTRSCVLAPTRNPDLSPQSIESELAACLGIRRILWVEAELRGDDTDGHIDNLARFVAPGRVVCARAPDASHPDHDSLERLRRSLATARDAAGRTLELIDLPLPPPIEADGAPLPASYANFLIVNGGVILPRFDRASDARAQEILEKCFPERTVVGVPCLTLVRGFGGPHCLSQQQPRIEPAGDVA